MVRPRESCMRGEPTLMGFFVVDVDAVVDNFYRCLMFESFWSSSQIKAIVIIELSN